MSTAKERAAIQKMTEAMQVVMDNDPTGQTILRVAVDVMYPPEEEEEEGFEDETQESEMDLETEAKTPPQRRATGSKKENANFHKALDILTTTPVKSVSSPSHVHKQASPKSSSTGRVLFPPKKDTPVKIKSYQDKEEKGALAQNYSSDEDEAIPIPKKPKVGRGGLRGALRGGRRGRLG